MKVFDADKVSSLVLQWRKTGDSDVLNSVLEETRLLAQYITNRYTSDNKEDMVQEALIKVMSSLRHYDPNISNIHTYFSTVIRNSCITYYAKGQNCDNFESTYIEDIENSVFFKTEDTLDITDDGEVQELILRNKQRFPSMDAKLVEKTTSAIYYMTRDGVHNKSRGIVGILVKEFKLNRTFAKILYRSTLVYMRMQHISNSTNSKSAKIPEVSLLPEIREFMGEEMYERFVCVFSGISINIK